jgi:hypothetical protein
MAFKGAVTIASLAFVLLGPGAAQGQESTTRGFTLGGHLSGASLTVEDGERNDAGGAGVRIGYGINRIVTLYLQLDGAEFDVDPDDGLGGKWTMGHGDIGARFHFANSLRSWVPYLEAALTGRVVSVTDAAVDGEEAPDVSFNGGAFTFGGGIMYYFTETLALDVELALSGGEFVEVEIGTVSVSSLDLDAASSRFSVGLAWWP